MGTDGHLVSTANAQPTKKFVVVPHLICSCDDGIGLTGAVASQGLARDSQRAGRRRGAHDSRGDEDCWTKVEGEPTFLPTAGAGADEARTTP